MLGLKKIIENAQRRFLTLCILCLFGPLIMLMVTIGVAEWVNQIYAAPIGWFAVAGAYAVGLILMLISLRSGSQSARFDATETSGITHAADHVVQEQPTGALAAEHALDDFDIEQIAALVDQQIQTRPLSTISVMLIAGAIAGQNPQLIEKVTEKLAA